MKILLTTLLITEFIAVSPAAQASLGQREETVQQDMGLVLANKHTTMSYANYNLHEISSEGLRLREYVSKSGVVFGLAWNGIGQPDLSLLLSDYFNDYSQNIKQPTRRLTRGAHHTVTGNSVVVEKSGHLRNIYGRAYVPGLIPTGVNADEIK